MDSAIMKDYTWTFPLVGQVKMSFIIKLISYRCWHEKGYEKRIDENESIKENEEWSENEWKKYSEKDKRSYA